MIKSRIAQYFYDRGHQGGCRNGCRESLEYKWSTTTARIKELVDAGVLVETGDTMTNSEGHRVRKVVHKRFV